ncbi:inositol-pentakisphosphate 2-kinase-like isoform X2 [Wolffia australiana]
MALRLWRAEDAAEWAYRGEGAANLVLGYCGSSPDLVGKVLRVQKVKRKKSSWKGAAREPGLPVLTPHERVLWRDVDKIGECTSKEIAGQLYTLHVLSPLLGDEHVDPGMHVVVSEEFLLSVEKNILGSRPSWRVDAAKVNTDCDSALLMSDHSFFPRGFLMEDLCVAIEIKPKCGFLPSSKFISPENLLKTEVTRFKMHQALKFHEGKIPCISEYDPLDLFSGSRERMSQAIRALFHCPQNNFRVFLNGSLVFGALGGSIDENIETDYSCEKNEAFQTMLKSVICDEKGRRVQSFLELIGEAIFNSGILDRLLKVQMLDIFDIEGAIHSYYNVVSLPCLICQKLSDPSLVKRCSSLHSLSLEESLKILRGYLISTTAKDCSIMVSFRPSPHNPSSDFGSVFLKSTGQTFDYKLFCGKASRHWEHNHYRIYSSLYLSRHRFNGCSHLRHILSILI